MRYNYTYLQDQAFLQFIDEMPIKEQFVKITLLDFKERPLQEIQGTITSGNINLNGDSSVRRTCNLSMVASEQENDLTNIDYLISINKKINLEIGFTNTTPYYTNYNILWIPLGVYIITSSSISHAVNNISISISLKDKMCLLNGECGGVFAASAILDTIEEIDTNGNTVIKKLTLIEIIQWVLKEWGGESLDKIIINDIEPRIKKIMKWTGTNLLYMLPNTDGSGMTVTTNETTAKEYVEDNNLDISDISYETNRDIGYIYSDFYYPGELIATIGSTVTSILDKIKNLLGNFEYFYDINGNFVFQEIKNYLNTSYSTNLLNNIDKQDYSMDLRKGKATYVFDSGKLISSYSNSPQFNMIKNDFLVWGKRKGTTGADLAIRYHLAIDRKPNIGNVYTCIFSKQSPYRVEKIIETVSEYDTYESFPATGIIDTYYLDKQQRAIYNWDTSKYILVALQPLEFISKDNFPTIGDINLSYLDQSTGDIYLYRQKNQGEEEIYEYVLFETDSKIYRYIKTSDWRSEIYLNGILNSSKGLETSYYYPELAIEWPKLYNLAATYNEDTDQWTGAFLSEALKDNSGIDYFLDFIDTNSSVSKLNISNIGRRTKAIENKDINCIFEPEIPNFILIESGQPDTEEKRTEASNKEQQFILIEPSIYSLFAVGGNANSAFSAVRSLLYQHTSYNETITVNALPIYYLEPNTRITVMDPQSGIYGDYMIKTISLPLDISGTMSLSCTRALENY